VLFSNFLSWQVSLLPGYWKYSKAKDLALQLPFLQVSKAMGNHDWEIADARCVD